MSEVHIYFCYPAYKSFRVSFVNWVFKCFFHIGQTTVRLLAIFVTFLGVFVPAKATTLLQLGLAQMAQQSTAIARVQVTASNQVLRGRDVFTVYQLKTIESLKTAPGGNLASVAVPGGAAGGIRQMVAGAPTLRVGGEYVLFLWTSRSGLTQIMGLSQGMFVVQPGAIVTRAAADEQMLNAQGQPVRADTLTMPWADLKAQVSLDLHSPAAGGAAGSK